MIDVSEAVSRSSARDTPVVRSFRDPAGIVFTLGDRVLRVVNASGAEDLIAFLSSRTGRSLIEAGHVVDTWLLDAARSHEILADPAVRTLLDTADGPWVVEHERVAFPTFPYEWSPEMLHAAGELTLQIAKRSLEEGFGLKDATPYNTLFRGPEPVFIDVLSFERRDGGDPIWLPDAQFARTFLLPLLSNKYLDLPLDQILSGRRDGLEPEEVYRWTAPLQRIRPPFLALASLPTWLAACLGKDDGSLYRKRALSDPARARYILDALLSRLARTLSDLAPARRRPSGWSDYMKDNHSEAYFAAKAAFVAEAIAEFGPKHVLDVGCNTGRFSRIAARAAASVVAIDRDPFVLSEVWHNARSLHLDILPLHIDIARPSPSIGWRNRECPSFLERARGSFDAVLMLGILHHLLVGERIPLDDVLDLAAELTTDVLIVEFIPPDDPMVRCLARGRDDPRATPSREVFEQACRRRFEIARSHDCADSNRRLYLLHKKDPTPWRLSDGHS
jgi:SAM-dependent methyltransferase